MALTEEEFTKSMIAAMRGLQTQGSFLDNEDIKKLERFFNIYRESIDNVQKDLDNTTKTIEDLGKKIQSSFEGSEEIIQKFRNEAKIIEKIGKDGDFDKAIEALEGLIVKIQETDVGSGDQKKLLAEQLQNEKKLFELQIRKLTLLKAEQKEQNSLNRILQTNRGKVDNFFKKLGFEYMGQQGNENPTFLGLKQLVDSKGENANLLKAGTAVKIEQVKNFLDPLNLLVNSIEIFKSKTIELFKDLDTTLAAFNKTSGAAGEYNDVIKEAWDTNRYFVVSMEEVAKATQSLKDNLRGFSALSDENKISLTAFASSLNRLGVSADSTSRIFSYLMDGMNQGPKQAQGNFEKLLGLSKTLGQSLSQVTEEFLSTLPELAKYGDHSISVFKQLAGTAKTLGIETGKLLDIAKGFDTFETAASNVGRLNAILGGPYLNTLQLMNMTEGERIQTLNEAFRATGRNWQSLNKYEKQAIATAAGISDMNDANKIFGGNLGDLSRYTREQAMKQEELNEQNKNAATLQEKWNALLSSLSVIALPVLEVLHSFVNVLLDVANYFGEATPAIVGVLGAIYLFAKVKGIFSVFKGLASGAKEVGEKILDMGGKVSKGASPALATKATSFFTTLGSGIGNFVKGVLNILPMAGEAIVGFAKAIFRGGVYILGAAAIIAGTIAIFKSIDSIAGYLSATFDAMAAPFKWFADALTESPLEEFQNEMEDLSEVLNSTSGDFSFKLKGLNDLFEATAMLSKINISPNLQSLSDFIEKIKIDPIEMFATNSVLNNVNRLVTETKVASSKPDIFDLSGLVGNKSDDRPINITVYLGDDKIVDKTIKKINQQNDIRVYGAGK